MLNAMCSTATGPDSSTVQVTLPETVPALGERTASESAVVLPPAGVASSKPNPSATDARKEIARRTGAKLPSRVECRAEPSLPARYPTDLVRPPSATGKGAMLAPRSEGAGELAAACEINRSAPTP